MVTLFWSETSIIKPKIDSDKLEGLSISLFLSSQRWVLIRSGACWLKSGGSRDQVYLCAHKWSDLSQRGLISLVINRGPDLPPGFVKATWLLRVPTRPSEKSCAVVQITYQPRLKLKCHVDQSQYYPGLVELKSHALVQAALWREGWGFGSEVFVQSQQGGCYPSVHVPSLGFKLCSCMRAVRCHSLSGGVKLYLFESRIV